MGHTLAPALAAKQGTVIVLNDYTRGRERTAPLRVLGLVVPGAA